MKLILQFKKGKNKPSILTCIREDGSSTWSKIHPGLEFHDLGHYAVESVLKYSTAFYGMILKGYDIGDFELPRDQRPEALIPANLTEDAIHAEYIVNQLQSEYFNYGEDPDFLGTLSKSLAEKELEIPKELNNEKLMEIRKLYQQLIYSWGALAPDKVLEIEFVID